MMTDRLADLVRDAVERAGVPPYPATAVAQRIALDPTPRTDGMQRTVRAGAAGLLLVTALAAVVPNSYRMTDAARRTFERLTGRPHADVQSYEVSPTSLDEARRHTTFPIVVPPGFRIANAEPREKNSGISLLIMDRRVGAVMLNEHWTSVPANKLEGIGVHDDGSIRRFNVRRWTIGRVAFSVAMFNPAYHAVAVQIEHATRVAAAHDARVTGTATR